MHIVVCVKQTPVTAEARFNPNTMTIVREGVRLTLNTFDRRATVEALRLRDVLGGKVTALTMGPPQAREVLVECLALGVDEAVHLTDPAFAGSDTLATSRALSLALARLEPDLVLCGRFSIDAETGQVPSQVAEFLDFPQITGARKIRAGDEPGTLWIERETDEGYEQWQVPLPMLLSVTEWIIAPRRATPEDIIAAEGKPLVQWPAAELGMDLTQFGAAGSPTSVAGFQSAQLEREARIISGDDPEAAAEEAVSYLLREGLFSRAGRQNRSRPRRPVHRGSSEGAIWVVAEVVDGQMRPVTYELLGKAQDLAEHLDREVAAVLITGGGSAAHVSRLGAFGADIVYVADDRRLANYETELYTAVLSTAISQHDPFAVLLPSTPNGRDLAPRVAARLGIGLTGDCIGLELDADRRLVQLKPAFGGDIVVPIYSRTMPQMASVRAGILDPVIPDWSATPRVSALAVPADVVPRAKFLDGVTEPDMRSLELDLADTIVGVGMGIGGPENLPVVQEMCDALDAPISCTLRVAGLGWMAYQLQIGLTGRAVAPRFYFAVGIAGAVTHMVGVKKAEHIIAINNDPEAAIFKACNFGIVGDWARIVPALTAALKHASSGAD